jgi:signal transduction histidine kinase/CheY-like chemotaxis protein
MTFKWKTIIGIACIQTIMLALIIWTAMQILVESNENELIKRTFTTTKLFAISNKDAVLAEDIATLESFVNEVLKNPGINYARILGRDGNVLAQGGAPMLLERRFIPDSSYHSVKDSVFDAFSAIEESGVLFGRVEIGFSINEIDSTIISTRRKIIALALAELLITALFSFILGSYLTKTIRQFRSGSLEILDGNLGYQIEVRGEDDLAKAALAFNQMSSQLENEIKERKKAEAEKVMLEKQLFQAQKMEAIGRLAGGIAHDFNNILTAIIGYSELGLSSKLENESTKEQFKIISESGKRAAALTEQLLLFSRKQVLEMKDVDLNRIIVDMSKMIKRLIIEDISFEFKSDTTSKIWGDKSKLEQVIMNLAVNAKDAMPNGGNFLLELSEVDIELEQVNGMKDIQIDPGFYIKLEAIDTGQGIPKENIDNIFEPFFTTKGLGKGTGLGLATVYGIIKQHNGFIFVDSIVDKGTTFKIYLPVSYAETTKEDEDIIIELPSGDETILIAEDEPNVLKFIVDILSPLGYNVLEATNGEDAIQLSHAQKNKIDLLLTDVVMPGMNGRELAEQLAEWCPGIKTIYMSGYTDDIIIHHGVLNDDITLLNKPIRPVKLAATIREVLNGSNEGQGV